MSSQFKFKYVYIFEYIYVFFYMETNVLNSWLSHLAIYVPKLAITGYSWL